MMSIRGPLICVSLLLVPGTAFAARSAEQALSLTPVQKNVDYERPTGSDVKACKIESVSNGKESAWVVSAGNGALLRRFIDSNGDNKIDQWCYAKDGIEVYRDIDADFNGKADQYRWYGTAGIRWGVDRNEDTRIDAWKWISPEEISAEFIQAVKKSDFEQFSRLLISKSEIGVIGLRKDLASSAETKRNVTRADFLAYCKKSKLTAGANWVNFNATRPGVVPASGERLAKDIVAYENVTALISRDGNHEDIPIGTVVKVGETWRLLGLPDGLSNGFFFAAAESQSHGAGRPTGEVSEEAQKFVKQLEVLDSKLSTATAPREITDLNKDRATILRQLADISSGQDKDLWLMQLVDSLNAATQSGQYPAGALELKRLHEQLSKSSRNQELIAQTKFAHMTAEYTVALQKPDAKYIKVQEEWLEDLEAFVKEFPTVPQAAEAIMQLAIAEEFAGEFDKANLWYSKIVSDFSDSDLAKKAAGAKRRIDSVGKSIRLAGKSLDGQSIDLASLRGNYVLVHYWATWYGPSKDDMAELRKLQGKYARKKFKVLGVNVDNDRSAAVKFVQKNRIPWPSLYTDGGLESKHAVDLGVFTLPVMMLVDKSGAVVSRSITVGELGDELKKRLRR